MKTSTVPGRSISGVGNLAWFLGVCLGLFVPLARAEEFSTLVYPSGSAEVRVAEGEVIEFMTLHYQPAGNAEAAAEAESGKVPRMRVTTGYATVYFQVMPMIQEQLEGRRRFYLAGPALVSFVDVAKPSTLLVTYRRFRCGEHGAE